MPAPPNEPALLEITKYPNRRFYDSTRSCHLTLEDIRGLIRDGYNVRIIDSETEVDITSKILMQIILEFDAPKVDLFTAPLLAEMIRVKDQVMRGFFEKFFNQALASFLAFHHAVESQIQQGTLLPGLFPAVFPWSTAALKGSAVKAHEDQVPQGSNPALAEVVQQLQQQVNDLQRAMQSSRRRSRARVRRKRSNRG